MRGDSECIERTAAWQHQRENLHLYMPPEPQIRLNVGDSYEIDGKVRTISQIVGFFSDLIFDDGTKMDSQSLVILIQRGMAKKLETLGRAS